MFKMFGLSAAHFLLAGALVGLVDVAGSSRCSETLAAESAPYWFWYQNGGAEHYWQHPIDPVNNRSGTACWEPADCKDASEMEADAGGGVHGNHPFIGKRAGSLLGDSGPGGEGEAHHRATHSRSYSCECQSVFDDIEPLLSPSPSLISHRCLRPHHLRDL